MPVADAMVRRERKLQQRARHDFLADKPGPPSGSAGRDDPEERFDEGLALLPPTRLPSSLLPEGASPLLPESDELALACEHLVLVRGMSVDLNQTENSREPPQQAKA